MWWKPTIYLGVGFLAILTFVSSCKAADESSQAISKAATLVKTGKLPEAEAQLWDVLTRHPENAQALNLLGSIRLQQKRFAEAETLLRRAISLAPDLVSARLNLARTFHAQDESDKEIAALVEAQGIAPINSEVNCALASAYLKQNDFARALKALEQIPSESRPDSAFPLLAASYLGLNRLPDAQRLAGEVTTRAAKNPRLRIEFAEVLLDFNLGNDALVLLQIAEKQQPASGELYFALGRARELKGEPALAQKDFQRAIALDPNSVDALQAFARIMAGQGQWEKCVEYLTRARKIAPDSPEVLRKLSAAELHMGHTAKAVEAAQQLVKLRPAEPESLYLLGVAQLQSEDTDGARVSLENYAKLRPQDPLAFLALGMLHKDLRDIPHAQSDFEQAIKLDPSQIEPSFQLALIFRDQGNNRDAITHLEKVVAAEPKNAPAQALLGTIYLQQQEYPKAQEHLTAAADLAPNSADTHYQLGLLFARLNQPDRAQREMAEFRKLRDKEQPSPAAPGAQPPKSSPPYPPS